MLVKIKCPACQVGNISLEPHMLAQGASFSCDSCDAEISVASQSKDKLQNSVMEYDSHKKNLLELQQDGNKPL